ncbi:MAG: alpha/beta hydrolase [Elainellaceae cyanobacterium]
MNEFHDAAEVTVPKPIAGAPVAGAPDWWAATFPQGQQRLVIDDAGDQPVAIAYGEVGQGPPLILAHGLGVWSYSWRGNIDALAQHYRVICVDAVGAGFSEKPMRPTQVGHQVVELARVIEVLCNRPAILVGQSLGGLTSLGVAIDYPHLVDRLVVINVPVFPKKLPSAVMRILAAIPQPLVYAIDRYQLFKRARPAARWIAQRSQREGHNPQEIAAQKTAHIDAYPYLESFGMLTCFARDLKLALIDVQQYLRGETCFTGRLQDSLGALAQPTLVLWGEKDGWFPVENGYALQRQLPNAKLQVIPGCGHRASESCPHQVNGAVLAFLGQP